MSTNRQPVKILSNQKGFTLIELVIVIVILGILAVVAVPRYQDMQTEAAEAAAEGVFGAAEGAAAINFSKNLVSPNSVTPITDGATLLGAMDGTPEGWAVNTDDGIEATINNVTYTITVSPAEISGTSKAVLTLTP